MVGSGWIGAEIAASARAEGLRGDDDRDGVAAARARARPGGSARSTSTSIASTGSSSCPRPRSSASRADGSVERVLTRDGASIETDCVVVGIGVAPRCGPGGDRGHPGRQRHPGRRAARDAASRACSPPATSPTPQHPFYGRRVRVEHWANARAQGPARRPSDARPAGRLRRDPLLLLRSVRRRHGVQGLCDRMGRGRLPR